MIDRSARLRRRWTSAAIGLGVLLSGCVDLLGPEPLEYDDGIEYFDEGLFKPLWNDLKQCSKLDGSLREVTFYYVPRETLTPVHGVRTLGMYFPKTHRIFIVQSSMADRDVVRHEMMHALLRETAGHPPKYFGSDGLCGYL